MAAKAGAPDEGGAAGDEGEGAAEVEALLGAIAADGRILRQLRFAVEIDRLKGVLRRNLLVDGSRRENSAEHSWHQAMLALLLVEHAPREGEAALDGGRVVRMLLVHDLVEIDAGDTFIYDDDGRADQADREARAADRLFGLLPEDQAAELRALWEEFEARGTPEARFARAVDRLQPLLANLLTRGTRWRHHGVTADRVRLINRAVGQGAPALGAVTTRLIEEAVARGFLPEGGEDGRDAPLHRPPGPNDEGA